MAQTQLWPSPPVWWLQIGFSIGASFLGGLLLLKVHWRWLWYISSAMALLMSALLMIMLPAEHPYPLQNQGRCARAGRKPPPTPLHRLGVTRSLSDITFLQRSG